MALRRRKSDDYIGPSTGIMKWVNKFCRFVLFPFIHPLFFVILLAVLGGGIVGIHYFADVAYKDIPSWVVTKSKSMFGDVSVNVDTSFITKFSEKIVNATNKAGDVLKQTDIVENMVPQKETKPIRETVRAIDRKAFRKAQDNPVNVKATLEGKQENVQNANNSSLFAFKRNNTLGLTYRKEPRIIKGRVEVLNVNEIKINGEQMFLYGIYSSSTSPKGIDGAVYLKSLVMDKDVECHVVAFTKNAELTAVCAVDGYSINHRMVDMGYSQNITLR